MAIIMGINEMGFGILLRGINNLKDNQYLDFLCEFIPQLIFLYTSFGYMMILIILKWNTNYSVVGTSHAPSIINQMINIPLKGGKVVGKALIGTEHD